MLVILLNTMRFPSRAAAVVFTAAFLCIPPAQPRAEVRLSPRLGEAPAISRGELLLSELSCLSCHSADRPTSARIGTRKGPILGEAGMRITPQYLERWLADPQGYKEGTTMPDVLHGFTAEEKAEAVEALTHYLTSLQPDDGKAAPAAEDYHLRQGGTLFHSIGCVACHAPAADAPAQSSSPEVRAALAVASIPLGDLARKTTADELAKFLLEPERIRPAGRMPSLGLTETEATSLAMYLLRDQLANPANQAREARLPGLRYQYYEDHLSGSPDFDKLTPKADGKADGFKVDARQRNESFGFRFTGTITVPESGRYTFYTLSDDGSQLFINGTLVVDNNGDHAPVERRGNIELPAGDHGLMVTFFNNGGGFELKVFWRGPNFEKQEIPLDVLSHLGQPMIPLDTVDFAVDPAKAAKGERLFGAVGCASCHSVAGAPAAEFSAKNFASLNPESSDGCLAPKPGKTAPHFNLSAEQRAALKETLSKRESLRVRLTPAEQVTHTMARLNCFACHTRDGQGGPTNERLDYFKMAGELDMGDEGRIPPHLTGVGNKLQLEWLEQVLMNKGWVRPYMATRMPQFSQANVGLLPAAFERADALADERRAPETTSDDVKIGRKLAGTSGLSCVACHTYGPHASLGIPAMDLSTMGDRLRYDWFHRYLIDPPSLRPGTRMPSFWPEGEAVNQDVLDGDTDAQIRALWAYLSEDDADVPDGLIQGQMEVVADTEPVIYRNFIAGAGSRAIGVGYPEKVNLAFDANNMRLAMIWQGAFIDAARHSTGRGIGYEPPLGHNVRHWPDGAPFALLDNPGASWPKAAGKAAGYRMIGYTLEEQRRPVFRYQFKDITVEDRFEPMAGTIDNYFRRVLRFRSEGPASEFYYRPATGGNLEAAGPNSYLVDGRLRLTFTGSLAGELVLREAAGGERELLVPIRLENGAAELIEEIIW